MRHLFHCIDGRSTLTSLLYSTVIQLARLSGFSPVITTASLHNASFLKSLGATHVIDRKLPAEELKAEATKLGGGLFPYVYDAVSLPDTLEVALALTAPRGDLVTVVSTNVNELRAAHQNTDRHIHLAHGLFASPINHEIGASLLAALPGLFASGDLKVSVVGLCRYIADGDDHGKRIVRRFFLEG